MIRLLLFGVLINLPFFLTPPSNVSDLPPFDLVSSSLSELFPLINSENGLNYCNNYSDNCLVVLIFVIVYTISKSHKMC